jgi:hypothetical protein
MEEELTLLLGVTSRLNASIGTLELLKASVL